MRPLQPDDVWMADGRLTPEVLLLNYRRLHWLRTFGFRLSSKRDHIELVPELWAAIAEHIESERLDTMDAWATVTILDSKTNPDGDIAVNVREVQVKHQDRESAMETEDYETFLKTLTSTDPHWALVELDATMQWTVWLSPGQHATLYCDVTSPDIIARIEKGMCWACGGGRSICPGCTGGMSQKFDCFMGCGVDLACPNCMGVAFALEDKDYNQTYYWASPPESVRLAREAKFDARLAELGYPVREWYLEGEEGEGSTLS